ncbi:MAG: hypothetical protein WC766_03730 [Patescibacteria group bacterium]
MCIIINCKDAFQGDSTRKSLLKYRHAPALFVCEWLHRRGLLTAGVTRTGRLVLTNESRVPENVMGELREAAYLFYVNSMGAVIGKEMLSSWLKDGVNSNDLTCSQDNGISVPQGAAMIKLCLKLRDDSNIVLYDIPVVRDDRKDPRIYNGG